jgi:phenylalanine dehydrogenase
MQIFQVSEDESVSTVEAANRFCEQKIQTRKAGNSFFSRKVPPKWQIKH